MNSSRVKKYVRIAFGVLMVAAGLAHFTNAEFFNKLVPDSISEYKDLIIVATGVYQAAVGVCFWIPRLHPVARWGTIVLLAGTLPPAIDQVIHPETIKAAGVPVVLAAIRVVVQAFQIWLVWWATSPDKLGPANA